MAQARRSAALEGIPDMVKVRAVALAGLLLIGGIGSAWSQTSEGSDAAGGQGGAEIESRVQQLEEQILDMQVQTGTLQSLAKSGAASSQGLRTSGGDVEDRVRGMEEQVQALAAQIQKLSRQMQAIEAKVGGGLQANSYTGSGDSGEAGSASSFGETVIEPSGTSGQAGSDAVESGDLIGEQIATIEEGGGDPNQAYEEAYGYMLQQDYASAEHAFGEFLTRFPKSKLAGNAQFWLGESFYVRGQYKQAADSFLKGYKGYKQSQKAPDSLLKLSMSLAQLGEQKAACAGFSRLESEFPNASAQVKGRAASERQKAGC